MEQYVIEDASFLIAVLNPIDSLHNEAIQTLRILTNSELSINFIFPEIAICETIFVLMRSGVDAETIRGKINRLSMYPRVMIINTDVLTALRYSSRYYNHLSLSEEQRNITRTHDYLIACTCLDFNGILISGDQQLTETFRDNGLNTCYFASEEDREYLENQVSIPF